MAAITVRVASADGLSPVAGQEDATAEQPLRSVERLGLAD